MLYIVWIPTKSYFLWTVVKNWSKLLYWSWNWLKRHVVSNSKLVYLSLKLGWLLVGRNKKLFLIKNKKIYEWFCNTNYRSSYWRWIPEGELPAIYNALKVTKETSKEIIVEVQYLIEKIKLVLSVTTTDGLKRGDVDVEELQLKFQLKINFRKNFQCIRGTCRWMWCCWKYRNILDSSFSSWICRIRYKTRYLWNRN
jgi:hypothetical protein